MIDLDATLVGAHSVKEKAAPTYKGGFGFHPLLADLDATGEALAGLLRPGNAGSTTPTHHVTVLVDALAQLPVDPAERRGSAHPPFTGGSARCRPSWARTNAEPGGAITLGVGDSCLDGLDANCTH